MRKFSEAMYLLNKNYKDKFEKYKDRVDKYFSIKIKFEKNYMYLDLPFDLKKIMEKISNTVPNKKNGMTKIIKDFKFTFTANNTLKVQLKSDLDLTTQDFIFYKDILKNIPLYDYITKHDIEIPNQKMFGVVELIQELYLNEIYHNSKYDLIYGEMFHKEISTIKDFKRNLKQGYVIFTAPDIIANEIQDIIYNKTFIGDIILNEKYIKKTRDMGTHFISENLNKRKELKAKKALQLKEWLDE